jgi:hypothetical protein
MIHRVPNTQTDADLERKRADETRLLRGWHGWHRAERDAVLAGQDGPMFERLLYLLKSLELKSATILLAYIRGIDWADVPVETRRVVLHEIDGSIIQLRVRHKLPPFDDGWPGQRDSAFVTILNILFPASIVRAPTGAKPGFNEQMQS